MVRIECLHEKHLLQVRAIDQLTNACPWSLEGLLLETKHPHHAGWVGLNDNDEVVGFLLAWLIPEQAHLLLLAVHPEYQGQGIATRLIEFFEQAARKCDIPELVLEVRESNQKARGLYEKLGWRQIGVRKKFYPDNFENAILYVYGMT